MPYLGPKMYSKNSFFAFMVFCVLAFLYFFLFFFFTHFACLAWVCAVWHVLLATYWRPPLNQYSNSWIFIETNVKAKYRRNIASSHSKKSMLSWYWAKLWNKAKFPQVCLFMHSSQNQTGTQNSHQCSMVNCTELMNILTGCALAGYICSLWHSFLNW